MDNHLSNIGNHLVPIEENNGLVAKVNSNISSDFFNSTRRDEQGKDKAGKSSPTAIFAFGRNARVSDMFISRYGIMGYAEYAISGEYIGGVILFPRKISLVLLFMGQDIWDQYQHDHFGQWNLGENIEKLDNPRHLGVKFVDEVYYWAPHPEYIPVDPNMVDQITYICDEVKKFLIRLDQGIDQLRGYKPENPKDDFNRLKVKGFLQE